ncbi:MAG: chemotaxis-specific protein-glutamate methyltransferase CheB [Planctomycetota bacterium]|jgi:two-component system response regulator WspF
MKVAIVNDLAVACEALRRVVASDAALEVAWIARDGDEAVAKARAARPDLVLMDLIMPRVDGVAATREIMRVAPCPILVVTATVSGNAGLVYEALGAGALDAVNTPTLGRDGTVAGGAELLRRIHLVERAMASAPKPRVPDAPRAGPEPEGLARAETPERATPAAPRPMRADSPPLVAIGASTGGPRAVASVLRALPRPLRAAVLLVQHVSHDFVAGYADWLRDETGHRVAIATPGERPVPGTVLVADGRRHLVLRADGAIDCTDSPADLVHRPSVDVLFRSLVAAPRPGVAILLTGMGRDGAEGLAALRAAGWHTVAQDEATSVVWGMPGAAVRLGAAREVLALDAIGPATARALGEMA